MQDTEQTSSLSKCDTEGHITKITKTEYYLEDGDVKERVILYGCTRCDATSETVWDTFGQVSGNKEHTGQYDCPCFGCKVKTLQLNAGDAKHSVVESGTTQKKWDKELAFYKEARAQGVQPEGTSRQAVQKALEASEVLNKPYDGGKMPKASHVNEKTVEVLKEVGAV